MGLESVWFESIRVLLWVGGQGVLCHDIEAWPAGTIQYYQCPSEKVCAESSSVPLTARALHADVLTVAIFSRAMNLRLQSATRVQACCGCLQNPLTQSP